MNDNNTKITVKKKPDTLAEYRKNETAEQKEIRLAKARETRKKNTKAKKNLKYQLEQFLKAKVGRPEWGFVKNEETGVYEYKQTGKLIFKKNSEHLVERLIDEAIDKDSKNVVSAFKTIAEITGEYKEETKNHNIVVRFENQDINI